MKKIGIEPLKLIAMTHEDQNAYPLAICVSPKDQAEKYVHYTFIRFDIGKDSAYYPKVIKQVLVSGEKTVALYEVYGMNEGDVKEKECVICMSEAKDTMLLPCRHYIVCGRCSSELISRTKKCPVCRISKRRRK